MSFQATMMDVPLTIDLVVDRAERWTAGGEVVSRRPDKTITRTTYGEVAKRARERFGLPIAVAGVHEVAAPASREYPPLRGVLA